MGSISLFNTVDNLYNTTQTSTDNTAQTSAGAKVAATSQTTSQDDSVKLSTQAQAKSLYKEGQSVSTIASSLGTDTKTINNYLGITLQKEIEQTLQSTLSAAS